jgi:hypothetical protein
MGNIGGLLFSQAINQQVENWSLFWQSSRLPIQEKSAVSQQIIFN